MGRKHQERLFINELNKQIQTCPAHLGSPSALRWSAVPSCVKWVVFFGKKMGTGSSKPLGKRFGRANENCWCEVRRAVKPTGLWARKAEDEQLSPQNWLPAETPVCQELHQWIFHLIVTFFILLQWQQCMWGLHVGFPEHTGSCLSIKGCLEAFWRFNNQDNFQQNQSGVFCCNCWPS